MLRIRVGEILDLETGWDCHGEPCLLRMDADRALPEALLSLILSFGTRQVMSPTFSWVDVPFRFRIYLIQEKTLRIVFRKKSASSEARNLLARISATLIDAGWPIETLLVDEMEKELQQWDMKLMASSKN